MDPDTWPEFPIEDPDIYGIWIHKEQPAVILITTDGRLYFTTFDSPSSFDRKVAFYCYHYFQGLEIPEDRRKFFRDPSGFLFG